jgi:hypothetical protein
MRSLVSLLSTVLFGVALQAYAGPAQDPSQSSQPIQSPDINIKAPSMLAQAPGTDQPVPLAQEPHHRLILQNAYVQVYVVEVPPQDSMYLHRHDLPYVSVSLGPADYVNAVSGKPDVHVTVDDGDTRYSEGGFVHTIRTDAGMAFNAVTVVLSKPQGTAQNLCKQVAPGAPGTCPQQAAHTSKKAVDSGDDDVPYFETDELRIDLIKVAGGKDYVETSAKNSALLLALNGANLDANLGGEHISFLHGGDVLWMPAGLHRRVVDFLGTKSNFLLISFKDSVNAAK